MYRRKVTLLPSLLTFLLLLILFQMTFPTELQAESVDNVVVKEATEVFQTTHQIDLDEGIFIPENTYLYGYELEGNIQVQYKNTTHLIPLESVRGVDEENVQQNKDLIINALDYAVVHATELDQSEESVDEVIEFEKETQQINEDGAKQESNKEEIIQEDSSNEELEENIEQEEIVEEPKDKKDDSIDLSIIDSNNEGASDEPEIDESKEEMEANIVEYEESQVAETLTTFSKAKIDPWKGNASEYFKVTTDKLIVYDNRGGSPLKPIGILKKGEVYPIVSDYGNWHRIQYGNIYGYVKKSETVPDDGSSLKNENKSYQNQSRNFESLQDVTVYDNTSGSLVPFGVIKQGQRYPIATDYGNWWRVLFTDRVGYVHKENVKAEFKNGDKHFRVHTDNLPVYDNRGSGPLKKVGELEKGESYSIVSDYGNWWRVQFGDIYGYVKKSDTGYATASEINNTNKGYSDTSHKYKAKKQTTVYDNTSGNLEPFGKLDKGTIFPIATDYGNWWRIIFLDRVGYVRKNEGELQYANFNTYFKAEENLVVYDNRGSNLKRIGKLEKGQLYPRVSDYGNWHRIQFGDIYGYVEKFETTPDNGSSIKNKNKNYTNTSRSFETTQNVTVYDNTSGSLVPFGTLDKGIQFPIATDYGNWWRILLSDRVGYVHKDEVKAEFKKGDKYFRVHTTNLPVYDNRGSGPLKKVGELVKGQSYSIVSDYGNWWRVQFGDFYGYVKKKDTGFATKSEIKNLNTSYSNSEDKFIPLNQVIVYDNTSGSLVPMGKVEKNVVYNIVSDYGNWWRIIYLDRVGFVRKTDVKDYSFQQGDRHHDIVNFKKMLNTVGFNGIQETNYFGNYTKTRVKQFQDYYGLDVNGKLNQQTMDELEKVYKSPFQEGKRHNNTIALKKKLNQLGYGTILLTSFYGSFTDQQVRKFQKDRGLIVNGIADAVTLNELDQAIKDQNFVKIFLDPGHGGHDPGAIGHGIKEKDIVLDIALKTADILTSKYVGIEVKLSRTTDKFIELTERAKMANKWGADYFISFHNNSFNASASGFESYIYNGNVLKETKSRQGDIHSYIASRINSKDRGMKKADFSVLRNTNMPAILIEYLFIDNASESSLLNKESYREKLGEITADAIAYSFGIMKR